MVTEFMEKRLSTLDSHIQKIQDLLGEYDTYLLYETEPRTRGKYRLQIEDLKTLLQQYEQEYAELEQRMQTGQPLKPSSALVLGDTSQRLHKKIDCLHEKIDCLLQQQKLLELYSDQDQKLLQAIVHKLNETQIQVTQLFIHSLESNQVSDLDVADLWAALEPRLINLLTKLPSGQTQLATAINDPELSARHRLKVAIPLIPFLGLVEYEAEFELGSGFNLKTAWEKLKGRLLQPVEIPEGVQGVAPLADFLISSAQAIPSTELLQLPADGAVEHDHYIYGTPKLRA